MMTSSRTVSFAKKFMTIKRMKLLTNLKEIFFFIKKVTKMYLVRKKWV